MITRSFCITLLAALATALPSLCAEKIVVRYAPIEQSIAVKELRSFTQEGTISTTLQTIFEKTGVDTALVRFMLGSKINLKEYDVDTAFVDRVLRTYLGEILLQDVGEVIRTSSGEASVQALRAAFINSVADDGQLSLIEFLEKYPTDLVIEGQELQARLARILKDIEDLQVGIRKILKKVQPRPRP